MGKSIKQMTLLELVRMQREGTRDERRDSMAEQARRFELRKLDKR